MLSSIIRNAPRLALGSSSSSSSSNPNHRFLFARLSQLAMNSCVTRGLATISVSDSTPTTDDLFVQSFLASDVWTATDLHVPNGPNIYDIATKDDAWNRQLSKLSENMQRKSSSYAPPMSSTPWTATGEFMEISTDRHSSSEHKAEWSGEMSYASAESDFTAANVAQAAVQDRQHQPVEWSHDLSFASPESDFVAVDSSYDQQYQHMPAEWSHNLSFASPESDFVAVNVADAIQADNQPTEWSQNLSFTSPESDFVAAATLERKQDTLFRTTEQALADPRAIVITSARQPFAVENVNDAWVGLCGYTRNEAVGRTLGELLQGPATDKNVVRKLVQELQHQDHAEAVVQNYTKDGREFRNYVRLAPIVDSRTGTIEQFVGVLQDIGNETAMKGKVMQG